MNTTQPQEAQFEDTIKPIIEEMVINLVQDKPSNVVRFNLTHKGSLYVSMASKEGRIYIYRTDT